MSTQRDRLAQLLAPPAALNGIDFVEIASWDEQTLRVHFLTEVDLTGRVTTATITGGEQVKTIAVEPIDDGHDWSLDAEDRPVLTLHTRTPGDFSTYVLTLESPLLDPYFTRSRFSFKAGCPSTLDCRTKPEPCPPPDGGPPIDYLAKDFTSFRKVLSDFSALRYPDWRERSEADFGVMFMEALSGLADDLSYTQDRIAAESTLMTATQRRSLVRHARLVDYEPRPATSARVDLQFDVGEVGPMPPGVHVSAQDPDGTKIEFETGTGLADTTNYTVDPRWNRNGPNPLTPYWWDDSQRCLPKGASEMWVHGHGHQLVIGMPLLIDTSGATSADPPIRQIVHLTPTKEGLQDFATEEVDPLYLENGAPTQVTHIRWSAAEALLEDHDLTRTEVAGNLVPATQGRRAEEAFGIPSDDPAAPQPPDAPIALHRTGPNQTTEYLYPLRNGPLSWLSSPSGPTESPRPEIALEQVPPPSDGEGWAWRRSLLEAALAERAFTLDTAAYRLLGKSPDGDDLSDYDGSAGTTLRFGDGVFGAVPDNAARFRLRCRLGQGAAGNVARDSITTVEPGSPIAIGTVTNPFPATGGADEETAERVRRRAPQEFRAVQYRAVRPEDYVAAAKMLPWVDAAGTVFRWTGSWLTVFTSADPKGTDELPPELRAQLIDLLNRRRLTGYESYVLAPRYVAIDVTVTVCVCPSAFRSDVQEGVTAALDGRLVTERRRGFFNPDNFQFGTPLERSRLEAAVQEVPGVDGVLSVLYKVRGVMSQPAELGDVLAVGSDQIVQVDNDPSAPWKGSVRVLVEGGK
jgi:hypothetical protein